MANPPVLVVSLCSLLLLAGCPEIIIDPEPTGGGGGETGGGSGSGGGGGSVAPGTVRVQYTGAPSYLQVGVGTNVRMYPAYPDGGFVYVSPMAFVDASATDTVSTADGTATGTFAGVRTTSGVTLSLSGDATRGASPRPPTSASTAAELSLCVAGTAGQTATLTYTCEGTATASGSGFVSILLGTTNNTGQYCTFAKGTQSAGTLPITGTATATVSGTEACFRLKTSLLVGADVNDATAGTASLSGGKVTLAVTLQ